jgi:hypothetical protein
MIVVAEVCVREQQGVAAAERRDGGAARRQL